MSNSPTELQKAADLVAKAERKALAETLKAAKVFDEALTKALDDLSLPANFPSNARQIINEMRQNHTYRMDHQLPQMIGLIDGPADTPIAPAP